MADMTSPRFSVITEAAADGGVLVLGLLKTPEGPRLLADPTAHTRVVEALPAVGATGTADEVVRLAPLEPGAPAIVLVGMGTEPVTAVTLRNAAGAVTRQLRGVDTIVFALPADADHLATAVLQGAAFGAYRFDSFRSKPAEAEQRSASSFAVIADVPDPESVVARASAVADAVTLVRDLVNTPPSHLFPQTFVERAVEAAAALPLHVEVLSEAALEAGGFGGILGVGQGSSRGPRLMRIDYRPDAATRHLALVGKGITFDTGGLSLKPPASMVGMKYDMTGAATMLAVTIAAATLAMPIRLTTWLALAENMPSGTAIRPNDVLTMHGGTTVEVLNTDAEGRLVLADALVAASAEQPDAIVDIATLTGAVKVALGDRHTGVMGDDTLAAELIATSEHTGEEFWQLPLPEYLREVLRSDVADIANAKPGNTAGGTMLAGVFLQEFVGRRSEQKDAARIPWLHLDIAATGNNEGSPRGHLQKGPTGVGVLSLLALAEQISRA